MGFIVTNETHLHHGLTEDQMKFIWEVTKDREGFFIQRMHLPEHLGTLSCGLYGPLMGDKPVDESEVEYRMRPNRKYSSRMVKRPMRETREVTIIAGPDDKGNQILYTAYGGPLAPRMPGDTTIDTWEGVLEARKFWAEHALAV